MRGELFVPAIVSEHRGNAEQINMDILSRWMQGRGIADRTWRGLLGVLRVHCPGLAQDIEETLRAEKVQYLSIQAVSVACMHGNTLGCRLSRLHAW